MAENVPLRVNGEPVDLEKWLKAVERNPQKNLLGVTQIKSVEELKQRAAMVLSSIKQTRKRMTLVTEQMQSLHK